LFYEVDESDSFVPEVEQLTEEVEFSHQSSLEDDGDAARVEQLDEVLFTPRFICELRSISTLKPWK